MSEPTPIPDSYTVTTKMLVKLSGLCRVTLWKQRKLGNLADPQRRPGVRGYFWTVGQANAFLRRYGRSERFEAAE